MTIIPLTYRAVSGNPEENCWICRDELATDIVSHEGEGPLGHPLHGQCYRQLVTASTRPTCGLCRREINIILPIPEVPAAPVSAMEGMAANIVTFVFAISIFIGLAAYVFGNDSTRSLRNVLSPYVNVLTGTVVGMLSMGSIHVFEEMTRSMTYNVLGLVSESLGVTVGSMAGIVAGAAAGVVASGLALMGFSGIIFASGVESTLNNIVQSHTDQRQQPEASTMFLRSYLGVLAGTAAMFMYSGVRDETQIGIAIFSITALVITLIGWRSSR